MTNVRNAPHIARDHIMPTTPPQREARRTTAHKALPERYYAESLSACDKRYAVTKRLRRRLKDLIDHTGADTPPKLAMCESVVFLDFRLEALRTQAIETGVVNDAVVVQLTNTMMSLMGKLGLDKAESGAAVSLDDYVRGSEVAG